MPTHNESVLAICAKYPAAGKVKTRLGAAIGVERAARLYRAFLLDLAERFEPAATTKGYALRWCYSPGDQLLTEVVGTSATAFEQRGAGLDERLRNASLDLREAGYRRAVIIGSDAPHLPAAYVSRALELLGTYDAVLGPAEDGGYYLVALPLRPEPPDIFSGIPMSTPTVLADTLTRATTLRLRVALLPPLFDVDELAELRRLADLLRDEPNRAPHTCAALAGLPLPSAR